MRSQRMQSKHPDTYEEHSNRILQQELHFAILHSITSKIRDYKVFIMRPTP